ncbi:hypothetical protein D7D52_05720 [Nocardia yunnanensis]|uniref:Uncharacterized protein n=1 Tax=Nocardia yunnanensis TaxID=2382165 RepID=A0A386Z752_9NOCA|nr:hypothetical protein [Nocardia yunnanensis]AYF73440.1 hypothetical protein D7D52_05720 [Nocardia yunnanensis]
MSTEQGRRDDLWSQDTDVYVPVAADYQPPAPPSRDPAPIGKFVAIAAASTLGMAVLAAAGVFIGSQFGKQSESTLAATEFTAGAATATQSTPPPAGAPLATVLAWIRAGAQVDPAKFHTATDTDGTATDLGTAVAFTSPTKKIQCMTPRSAAADAPGLSCLVNFDNPPPRPAGHPNTEWNAGWVDFPGETAGVGRAANDQGQFALGYGATLTYGSRLTFDDYECRMDQTGLICADPTAGSALQLSSSGPAPFGCFAKLDSKSYGIGYSCTGSDATVPVAPPRPYR